MNEEEPLISLLDEAETSEEINLIENDQKFQFPKKLRKPYVKTRDIWYNDYTVPETYVNFNKKVEKSSHSGENNQWGQIIDSRSVEIGQDISAIEAVDWKIKDNIDCRPKIYDNITKLIEKQRWSYFQSINTTNIKAH